MSLPEPFYADESVRLYLGDALEVLAAMEAGSVSAIVTDPPYGLEFMGKEWDRFSGAVSDRDFKGFVLSQQRTRNVKCPECGKWAYDHPGRLCECGGVRRAQSTTFQAWCEQWATECLRVLKPGGHMLAFGGTRTWHRLTCAIEDAGFEVRDSVADLTGIDGPGLLWLYGSGFPKSLDVSKAIDKAAGAVREVVGASPDSYDRAASSWQADDGAPHGMVGRAEGPRLITAPATEDAARWEGWGTALKPAWEPIVVARKPLAGPVAANVLECGTGALNVNGCRVGAPGDKRAAGTKTYAAGRLAGETAGGGVPQAAPHDGLGRWPSNVVLGQTAAAELDRQSGSSISRAGQPRKSARPGDGYGMTHTGAEYGDSGGASRFFSVFRYEAKAGATERPRLEDGTAHPTVKPVDLMAWLVRLVTPPGGLVLDPFAGSGTTAEACIVEGFRCLLIEKDPKSAELIRKRLRKDIQPTMFGGAA